MPGDVQARDRAAVEESGEAVAVLTLESTEPIAFRRQNFGDYEIPSLQLKEGLEAVGRSGFGLHVRE